MKRPVFVFKLSQSYVRGKSVRSFGFSFFVCNIYTSLDSTDKVNLTKGDIYILPSKIRDLQCWDSLATSSTKHEALYCLVWSKLTKIWGIVLLLTLNIVPYNVALIYV